MSGIPHDDDHELFEAAEEHLESLNNKFDSRWDFESFSHWHLDQEKKRLTLEGAKRIECEIQIIGSYSKNSETWLWSWDNDSIEENLTEASKVVRSFGANEGIEKLVNARWYGSEADGWSMTSLAALLSDGIACYKASYEGGSIFMVIYSVEEAMCYGRN